MSASAEVRDLDGLREFLAHITHERQLSPRTVRAYTDDLGEFAEFLTAYYGTPKATAARDAILSFLPGAAVSADVRKITDESLPALEAAGGDVLLSAVDNAAARLTLQRMAAGRWPLVHGGTDVAGADCFVQLRDGPTLDEQMYGALARAAAAETAHPREPRAGGCAADPSYIVPGLLCGAMTAVRVAQLADGAAAAQPATTPPPVRWRSGWNFVEERDGDDEAYAADDSHATYAQAGGP